MEVKILIPTVQDAAMFVAKMERVAGEADLKRGKWMVDAKSLMGVLQLGVGTQTTLEVHGELDENQFRNLMKDYVI